MKKFEKQNIIPIMEQIVALNTEHYKEDLKTDINLLRKAASIQDLEKEYNPWAWNIEEKYFLWLCRPNGTNLFDERSVFIKGSTSNVVTTYYRESYSHLEDYLLFAIELSEKSQNDKEILGTIYPLNYEQFCLRLDQKAVELDHIHVFYEQGDCTVEREPFVDSMHPEYGGFVCKELVSKDEGRLTMVLTLERIARQKAKVISLEKYFKQLAKVKSGRVEETPISGVIVR